MNFTHLASYNSYFRVEFVNLFKQKIEEYETSLLLKLNEAEFTIDFFKDSISDRHYSSNYLKRKKLIKRPSLILKQVFYSSSNIRSS